MGQVELSTSFCNLSLNSSLTQVRSACITCLGCVCTSQPHEACLL